MRHQPSLTEMLADAEKHSLDKTLPRIFGYHAVQIGRPEQTNWLAASPIRQKIYFSQQHFSNTTRQNSYIYGDYYQLPFIPASIDLFLLAHSLEHSSHPLTLLNEVHRSLMPEGRIIILGFNPFSLWGMWYKKTASWPKSPINLNKMRNLLNFADFEVEEIKSIFFRPPLTKRLQQLHFLEKLGATLWPLHGAVYQIKAKKRLATFIPIKPRWQHNTKLLTKGLAEPSANRKSYEKTYSNFC